VKIDIENVKPQTIAVTLKGRKRNDVRIRDGWLDWMFRIGDFRDIINGLNDEQVDRLFLLITEGTFKIKWVDQRSRQEYRVSPNLLLVRRAGPGRIRKAYQTVALFVKVGTSEWPLTFKIPLKGIAALLRAMITIDTPPEYRVRDSIRNAQFIWAIFWLRKEMKRISFSALKLTKEQILRLGLP